MASLFASDAMTCPNSPSFSPTTVQLDRYDHSYYCKLPYARCRCHTIPRELMAVYEPNTHGNSAYVPMSACAAMDQMDEVTIGGAFMKLYDGEQNIHIWYTYGPDGELLYERPATVMCHDCKEVERAQALYQETATNVMASLWEMSDTTFDTHLQWLPREMLEDVWDLVTKSYNGNIGFSGGHTFTTAAYEFDYLAGGVQPQFLADLE